MVIVRILLSCYMITRDKKALSFARGCGKRLSPKRAILIRATNAATSSKTVFDGMVAILDRFKQTTLPVIALQSSVAIDGTDRQLHELCVEAAPMDTQAYASFSLACALVHGNCSK